MKDSTNYSERQPTTSPKDRTLTSTTTVDGRRRWKQRGIRQDRRQDRHANRIHRKPFSGVDGEGGNFPSGHEYMLLRAGEALLDLGHPLSWHECLSFLADLPKDRIYVAYFFDYDVTMMLRSLPPERIQRLLNTDSRRVPHKPCSAFPVDIGGEFQIDYLPRKEFKVRRIGGEWTVINDVGSFFQTSFVNALRKWFGNDPEFAPVIDRIAEGKEQRHDFGAVTEDERQYNLLEIRMLERLMERFREMCDALDIRPTRWQGPGNLVSAVFKREGLPLNKDLSLWTDYADLARMANAAYYGGRFEVSTYGRIPGPIYQYDINSAYATTYQGLPCLVHGEWESIQEIPTSGSLYVGEVTFQHGPEFQWCTLPIRTNKGTITFPRSGRGIYWSHEIDVARKYGADVQFHRGYRYVPRCNCRAFEFVDEMYAERQRLGKDGKGMVLKLVLASTYGKLAQSVGCAPYSNPVWAGLIVSQVRAQLIDAALRIQKGRHVLMLATDGLFTRQPIKSLKTGSGLGEWDLTEHEDIFIVQSGVYFLPGKAPKTRGVPQSRVLAHEPQFRQRWDAYLSGNALQTVPIPLNNFIGLRLAHARGKPDTAGQWADVTKEISFDWNSKRMNPALKGTYVVTEPVGGSPELMSEEYNRVIGGINARERLTYEDQPDWGDCL